MEDIKEEAYQWLANEDNIIHIDMLQVKQVEEAGFFLNQFFTMDLKTLQSTVKSQIRFKVGL